VKKKSRHVKLLNGIRIKKKLFFRYAGVSLLCLGGTIGLVCAGFYFDTTSQEVTTKSPEPERSSNSAPNATAGDPSPEVDSMEMVVEESPLLKALRGHVAALDLAESQSITMWGTYTSANAPFAIAIFAKKPNLYRQSLRFNELAIDAGFDGKEYWENPQTNTGTDIRTAFNDQLLVLESAFAALVWHFEAKGVNRLSLEKAETTGAEDRLVLRNDALLPDSVYHHLDAETHLETMRTAVLRADEGSIEVEIHYEYKRSEPQPEVATYELSGYRMRIDGEEISVASLDAIESNRGVMPWMFARPATSTAAR